MWIKQNCFFLVLRVYVNNISDDWWWCQGSQRSSKLCRYKTLILVSQTLQNFGYSNCLDIKASCILLNKFLDLDHTVFLVLWPWSHGHENTYYFWLSHNLFCITNNQEIPYIVTPSFSLTHTNKQGKKPV